MSSGGKSICANPAENLAILLGAYGIAASPDNLRRVVSERFNMISVLAHQLHEELEADEKARENNRFLWYTLDEQ